MRPFIFLKNLIFRYRFQAFRYGGIELKFFVKYNTRILMLCNKNR